MKSKNARSNGKINGIFLFLLTNSNIYPNIKDEKGIIVNQLKIKNCKPDEMGGAVSLLMRLLGNRNHIPFSI